MDQPSVVNKSVVQIVLIPEGMATNWCWTRSVARLSIRQAMALGTWKIPNLEMQQVGIRMVRMIWRDTILMTRDGKLQC